MQLIRGKSSEEPFDRELLPRRGASQGRSTIEPRRIKCLRIALQLVGLIFIFGVYVLTLVWPSGWSWHAGSHTPHYLQMILGIYATLGTFLLIASRKPLAHLSLIWFTVWSSIVHGAIMGIESFSDPAERGHLFGDVPALFLLAIILGVLMSRTAEARA